jgi:hypothetical protein
MSEESKKGLRHLLPAAFSGIATAITALAGLLGVLHETGYFGNHAPLAAPVVSMSGRDLATAQEEPITALAAVPARRLSVVGAWHDLRFGCHVIKQIGNDLEILNYDAEGAVRTVGLGRVRGRKIHLHLNKANPYAPDFELFLPDDGRELTGMAQRADQEHAVHWRYAGVACNEASPNPPAELPRQASATKP